MEYLVSFLRVVHYVIETIGKSNNLEKIMISPGNIVPHYEIAPLRVNAREFRMLEQYNGNFETEIAQTGVINLMQLQLGFDTEIIDLIK